MTNLKNSPLLSALTMLGIAVVVLTAVVLITADGSPTSSNWKIASYVAGAVAIGLMGAAATRRKRARATG